MLFVKHKRSMKVVESQNVHWNGYNQLFFCRYYVAAQFQQCVYWCGAVFTSR